MKTAFRAVSLTALVVAGVVLTMMVLVSPTNAATTGKNCKDVAVGSGWEPKQTPDGSPATVPVDAPAGFLIDKYCVKAGSGSSAAVTVLVDPPAAHVVIDHRTKNSVGHYAIHLIPAAATSDLPSGPGTGGPPSSSAP